MQYTAYVFLRIYLPRTPVNKGKQGVGPERNFLLLDVR